MLRHHLRQQFHHLGLPCNRFHFPLLFLNNGEWHDLFYLMNHCLLEHVHIRHRYGLVGDIWWFNRFLLCFLGTIWKNWIFPNLWFRIWVFLDILLLGKNLIVKSTDTVLVLQYGCVIDNLW
jgi:hypothetical protein